MGECKRRIQKVPKSVDDVFGSKGRPIRERHGLPQLKDDGLRILADLPGRRQFRLGLLRQAIDPDQHAFGQIAHGFFGLVRGHQRIQRLGLVVERESQFGPGRQRAPLPPARSSISYRIVLSRQHQLKTSHHRGQ